MGSRQHNAFVQVEQGGERSTHSSQAWPDDREQRHLRKHLQGLMMQWLSKEIINLVEAGQMPSVKGSLPCCSCKRF